MLQNPKNIIFTHFYKVYIGILTIAFVIACIIYSIYSYKSYMRSTIQLVYEESVHGLQQGIQISDRIP